MVVIPSYEKWIDYPENVECAATTDVQSYKSRMSEMSPILFSSETEIDIYDFNWSLSSEKDRRLSFENSQDVENYLLAVDPPETRIINLCLENSLEPLLITEDCMKKLLTYHEIGTIFLDVLFAFGGKARNSEAGFANQAIYYRPDGSYDLAYVLVYVEENKGTKRSSWPIRQIGVFHRHVPKSSKNLWIFINPMRQSAFQQRLENTIILRTSPFPPKQPNMHILVISSYIPNWRWYLNSLNEEFEEIADIVLTLDFHNSKDYTDGFTNLSRLQHLQDKILPLTARFEASSAIMNMLMEENSLLYEKHKCTENQNRHELNKICSYTSQYKSHLSSIETLNSRIQGILGFLGVALNLKNQATSVDINHHMLALTQDTVDDSTAVRVVTLVTLIYLPASFVATLLGTNLFSFDGGHGSSFQISGQFWIYIAISLPLTIITVGSWFIFTRRQKRAKLKMQQLAANCEEV